MSRLFFSNNNQIKQLQMGDKLKEGLNKRGKKNNKSKWFWGRRGVEMIWNCGSYTISLPVNQLYPTCINVGTTLLISPVVSRHIHVPKSIRVGRAVHYCSSHWGFSVECAGITCSYENMSLITVKSVVFVGGSSSRAAQINILVTKSTCGNQNHFLYR